jgi:urease accessory protein
MNSSWHARLSVRYLLEGERTVARFTHEGPLRILQTLYPEEQPVAHNVLVHPPSGIAGGDVLDIAVEASPGTHALITTPGASRFYRSDGLPAMQRARIVAAAGARIEWLPLEAICYSGCMANNEVRLALAPGAEAMGWDIVALGLPGAARPFVQGSLTQHLELEGHWLERARIDAADTRLMDGPLGLAGHRCMATLFFASGHPLEPARRERALEAARAVLEAHELVAPAGATAPGRHVVAVRALASVVEPAIDLLRSVRAAWRRRLWDMDAPSPRTWAL